MPGRTVTEKNHWKDRLSKRIDRRIETIAAEEPNLLDRVKRDARERAMRSLNVAELQADVELVGVEKRPARLAQQQPRHLHVHDRQQVVIGRPLVRGIHADEDRDVGRDAL